MENINIIIPYRDREVHLRNILECLKCRFKDTTVMVHVYVVEQTNEGHFNCGLMKNIGFLYCLNYNTLSDSVPKQVIFNDVDCWPETSEAIRHYLFECPVKIINHIYGRSFCLGGIFSIRTNDFILVNGFPNDFEGWGGEDNLLEIRMAHNNIIRYIDESDKSTRYERHLSKPHITEDAEHDRDITNRDLNEIKWKKGMENLTGLKDIQLETVRVKHQILSNNLQYHHIYV